MEPSGARPSGSWMLHNLLSVLFSFCSLDVHMYYCWITSVVKIPVSCSIPSMVSPVSYKYKSKKCCYLIFLLDFFLPLFFVIGWRERQKLKVPSLRLATCLKKDRNWQRLLGFAPISYRVNEQLCQIK